MNNYNRILATLILALWGSLAWADGHGKVAPMSESNIEKVARAWIEAGHKGQEDLSQIVQKHMAVDGVTVASRYIGFGFQLDPNDTEQLVVAAVTPGTPADRIGLKVGDVFESVAGVEATKENRYRMAFRGKPGQPVEAVIRRNGQSIPLRVQRGIITARSDKATTLRNIQLANAETWPVTEGRIIEIIGEANVVYVIHEIKDIEDDTGIPFENRIISRFVFNDKGQVEWAASRGESRFVLEQQGYTISR